MLDVEARRQAIQGALDAARSARERNRLGQFATPPALALDIARYALELWQHRDEPATFLDPAIGSGSFYSAVRQTFPPRMIGDACGVELDPRFTEVARDLWSASGLRVRPGDFTRLAPDRTYNLILTNPPYVRHHHLAREEKERLRSLAADRLGLETSGLAGLYVYFLLLSDAWLAPSGLAVWLIPSEFLDVNYGAALKTYLTERVTLQQIHRYRPSDVQFGDALVTSAIVVFTKSPPPPDHQVRLSLGGPITAPARSELVPLAAFRDVKKWTALPDRTAPIAGHFPTLGDLFTIRRGIATGANSFFILDRQEALQKGIPPEYLRPILPGSRYLPNAVIESAPDGYPRLEKTLALIDCDLPEPEVQRRFPAFWSHLEAGKARGIAAGYLASRRSPWYSQEHRAPAPFLCTYMGRAKGNGNPFRFFWNRSRATAANVYLLLYPRADLASALESHPDLYPAILTELQSLTAAGLIREGRVYGGGLHKLEPRELASLPAGGRFRR